MDRSVVSTSDGRQCRPLCVSDLCAVRLSGAGGAIWQLDAAVRGDPDRTDVPVRGHHRRAYHGPGRQHLDPDRLPCAGGTRGQERDPDRRVRARHRARRQAAAGGCHRGLPAPPAAHPDDLVRLHLRCAAAGGVHRFRLGDAPGGRRCRVLRHARRHAVRPGLHADLLHGGAQPRGRQERGQADPDDGGRGGVSLGDADGCGETIKKKSRFFAAVAACSLLLAAPASAQGVKIGILNEQSGVYADYGGKYPIEAARMAIEDFGGEVLGHKIELVTADHQNKPDLAVSIARRWYDTDNVDMITELTTSSVALAVQELSRDKKKIDIVVGAATSRLTGDACTAYGFHWAFDTHELDVGTGGALVKAGGDTWFFLTADYAFGYALEKDTSEIVTANGGKVLGSVRIPLNSSDFSSFLLQAQSSKAKIVGLANAGLDTTNSIKQAAEFGIVTGGQKLAGLLMTLAEVHGLGLQAAQGLVLTEGFYWDLNDKTRAFSQRFMKRTNRMPNMIQAGTYSATLSYLKAVKAANSKDTEAVAKKLKELPVDDAFAQGKVLENGRMVHDLYLFEVKKPSESKKAWDYYKLISTAPGDKAFPKAKDSGCPLTK